MVDEIEPQILTEEDGRISVLLLDDHQLSLDGMLAILEARAAEFCVVGAVRSVKEALQIVANSLPDVVVLDLKVLYEPASPEERIEAGLDAIREIRRLSPSTKVVVVSAYRQPEHIAQALQAGAVGYVYKGRSSEEVLESLRRAHVGQVFFHPEIAQKLLETLQRPESSEGEERESDPLTPREREVLQLIAEGKSNQEIANQLQISIGTVKKHVTNILDKIHLRSRVEAALYWRTQSQITLPRE